MQTIYLDISNKGAIPTIYAKQGDVGRKFSVVLTDSGIPYVPPVGSVFSAWYEGDSGEGNYTDIGEKSAFSVNGNKVTVEMISQMLSNDGDGVLCIVLNALDGNQLGSWNIPYICEFVPGANSEEAKSYYTAFSQAVSNLPIPDETLSIKGKPADAAAVGEAVERLSEEKAPAGYVDFTNAVSSYFEFNTLIENTFAAIANNSEFRMLINFENSDGVVPAGTWFISVKREWENYGIVEIVNDRYRLERRKFGDWLDWEWNNPPLIINTEYRTTERWNDNKPVYTKLVYFGTMPNSTASAVAHGADATQIIRTVGQYLKTGRSLPMRWYGKNIDVFADNTHVCIETNFDCSDSEAYVQIWYVKD